MTNRNLQSVVRLICVESGIKEQEMFSKSRKRPIVWSRYIFSHLAHKYLGWTEGHICHYLNKDRTSIYHYQMMHRNLYMYDKDYIYLFNEINKFIDMGGYEKQEPIQLTQEQQTRARLFNKSMLIGLEA